ncbi:MAG TPA: insulinase family protein [Saprospiraceae bacterium]|nr:insulinase family protein [Saprospiraceae bacterium]
MYKFLILSWFILALTVACSPKLAQPKDPAACEPIGTITPVEEKMSSLPKDPSVKIGKLANGLTYYIKANPKPEKRAELRMAVKAGSMQEDPDQQGLAHFVEHMAFNGTTHFTKNEMIDYLESVGTRFGPDLNAYTSFDETVYMLQVRTDLEDQFDKGMLILRDWAGEVSFDDNEIDKERGVVISEWRSGLSPDQRMSQKSLPLEYYKSRYAERLPIGHPDTVRNAKYDAVRRFYRDWYRPDLMAVVVVGDIDPVKVEAQIISQFGDLTGPAVIREKVPASFPPHEETFARVITDAEATNSGVSVSYKHKFRPVENILDFRDRLVYNLYNRMLGRRLTEISRQANPPFIFGFSGYGQDVGELATYSSFASAEAKNIQRAYKTLLEENQRVLLHGFTDTELEREKAAFMRQAEQNVLEQDKQESNRIVGRLISNFLTDAPMPDAMQTLDMYKSMMPTITNFEISQLASKWITDNNRVVIVTGPDKDKALLPDSTMLVKMMKDISQEQMDAYVDVDVSAPLLAGSFPAKQVMNVTHDANLDIYHWEFANGVHVTAKPTTFKNDEILMSAYSQGGHSLYNLNMYPSARSASAVVGSSGLGSFNATALDKKLSSLRVNVSPFISERYEGLSGSASVSDKETMMQLIYSYVTDYRKDTTALNSYVSREKSRYTNLLANPQNWFFDKLSRITSGNNPRRGLPPMESYDKINMDEIMNVYHDRFADVSDMDFFFVGNFNVDTLQLLTSRYLGALPGNGRKENWKDVGDRYPAGIVDSTYNRGEAPKSLVQIIYHGEATFNPDSAYVLQSLVEIARIKLREELREEESGVYGVSVSGGLSKYPINQYSINISFNADPPKTNDLVNAAKMVIAKMKDEIDPADIAKVTETQRQGRIKDLQQNQFWMGNFINSWMNGTDLSQQVELAKLEERIARLNKDVLLRAARKYFNNKEVISLAMFPDKT